MSPGSGEHSSVSDAPAQLSTQEWRRDGQPDDGPRRQARSSAISASAGAAAATGPVLHTPAAASIATAIAARSGGLHGFGKLRK
jgi:hypothetical protein